MIIRFCTLLAIIFFILTFSSCNRTVQKSETSNKRPILIFTDCGAEIDDQWMLVHLLGKNDLEIKGIFSSHHGSRTSDDEAVKSREIIDELIRITGNDHIPAYTGSDQGLNSRSDNDHSTADIIYEIAQEHTEENRLTMVISGPATDVAGALIKYPEIAAKIEICATAFYSREIGSSYNVHNDPLAWQILLEQDIPITVSPNPVSLKSFLVSVDEMKSITDYDSDIAEYLAGHYMKWISENTEIVTQITGYPDKWPIWDQILTAYLSGYCRFEETTRPVLLDNGYFNYSGQYKDQTINWITECDTKQTWDDFREIIMGSTSNHQKK